MLLKNAGHRRLRRLENSEMGTLANANTRFLRIWITLAQTGSEHLSAVVPRVEKRLDGKISFFRNSGQRSTFHRRISAARNRLLRDWEYAFAPPTEIVRRRVGVHCRGAS